MRRSIIISLLTSLAVVVVIGVSLSGHPKAAASSCNGVPTKSYHITISGSTASLTDVKAHRCDSLVFTNKDNQTREIAFGPHENHEPYDGVYEEILGKDQSATISLKTLGSYHWHDHLDDAVQGYFTVSQ